jgi:hypothetical protein
VQFLSGCLPNFLTSCDAGSMEALPELTKAQAATTCTILVSLLTLFFNPLRCRQHGGSARTNKGSSCHHLYNSCLIAYLFLTLCVAGSIETLPEQTEAQTATACKTPVSFFTLFFNPLRCRQHGASNKADRVPRCHRLHYSCFLVYLIF